MYHPLADCILWYPRSHAQRVGTHTRTYPPLDIPIPWTYPQTYPISLDIPTPLKGHDTRDTDPQKSHGTGDIHHSPCENINFPQLRLRFSLSNVILQFTGTKRHLCVWLQPMYSLLNSKPRRNWMRKHPGILPYFFLFITSSRHSVLKCSGLWRLFTFFIELKVKFKKVYLQWI